MEERQVFFEKLMNIIEEAEGKRDTIYGPFSFLWENSYVRDAVVSSFPTTTSITGLKMHLATNVLKMHAEGNQSRISYEQLKTLVQGSSSKKYSINYAQLDECMDVAKNKEAIRQNLYTGELLDKSQESLKYLERSEELFPYLFMDKLRSSVWSNLRNFFKLCEQSVCSECSKKTMVYFRFIQEVALYEIFYTRLIQDQAAEYMEDMIAFSQEQEAEISKMAEQIKLLNGDHTDQLQEALCKLQKTAKNLSEGLDENILKKFYQIEVYQLMLIEFGISLNAMCYLLMLFEAIQVCTYQMRGISHLSLEIANKLSDIYDKDLVVLEEFNHKRVSRYKAVNKRIEELLAHQYPKCETYDAATVIDTFMEELCLPKAIGESRKNVFRGLEVMLGYPIYHEGMKETQ